MRGILIFCLVVLIGCGPTCPTAVTPFVGQSNISPTTTIQFLEPDTIPAQLPALEDTAIRFEDANSGQSVPHEIVVHHGTNRIEITPNSPMQTGKEYFIFGIAMGEVTSSHYFGSIDILGRPVGFNIQVDASPSVLQASDSFIVLSEAVDLTTATAQSIRYFGRCVIDHDEVELEIPWHSVHIVEPWPHILALEGLNPETLSSDGFGDCKLQTVQVAPLLKSARGASFAGEVTRVITLKADPRPEPYAGMEWDEPTYWWATGRPFCE